MFNSLALRSSGNVNLTLGKCYKILSKRDSPKYKYMSIQQIHLKVPVNEGQHNLLVHVVVCDCR